MGFCFLGAIRPNARNMFRALACAGSLGLASGKIYFSETFGDGWESRWTASKWKDSEGTQGKFVAATGKWFGDAAEDQGIQTSEDSKFFGISWVSIPSATRAK